MAVEHFISMYEVLASIPTILKIDKSRKDLGLGDGSVSTGLAYRYEHPSLAPALRYKL